jgi:hypothetical protein
VGFGEDINLFETGGISNPLWTSFRHLGEHVAWFLDNVPFNWMKNLPWNKSKTARLQEELDQQLLAILRERLAHMGIAASALEGGVSDTSDTSSSSSGTSRSSSSSSSSSSNSSSSLGAGSGSGGCPMHAAGAEISSSSSSSSGMAAGAAGAEGVQGLSQCPVHAAANPDATASSSSANALDVAMLEAKDILSLAVKLSESVGYLDKEVLLSQMKTFFAAGHDTTASLVAWAVYHLLQNPKVDKKLREEVDAVLGGGSVPTYQQLSEMKFLNMVLKVS